MRIQKRVFTKVTGSSKKSLDSVMLISYISFVYCVRLTIRRTWSCLEHGCRECRITSISDLLSQLLSILAKYWPRSARVYGAQTAAICHLSANNLLLVSRLSVSTCCMLQHRLGARYTHSAAFGS